MSVIVDEIIIIVSFAIYGAIHSFLASNYVKRRIIEEAGDYIAFYRLFYNIFALISLFIWYDTIPRPRIPIYDLVYPFDFIILTFQIISLMFLIWSIRYFDGLEFMGIKQIIRWINKEYNIKDIDEKSKLRTDGLYRISRHPLYLFTILFFVLRPQMDLFYLTLSILLILYFYIGSIYEEKKLVEKFGDEYLQYKNRTGRILPKLNFIKRT